MLVSEKKYYYFGNKALDISSGDLQEVKQKIMIKGPGYKYITETDVSKLLEYIRNYNIKNLGYNEYGKYGEPNNQDEYPQDECKSSCNCYDKRQC